MLQQTLTGGLCRVTPDTSLPGEKCLRICSRFASTQNTCIRKAAQKRSVHRQMEREGGRAKDAAQDGAGLHLLGIRRRSRGKLLGRTETEGETGHGFLFCTSCSMSHFAWPSSVSRLPASAVLSPLLPPSSATASSSASRPFSVSASGQRRC